MNMDYTQGYVTACGQIVNFILQMPEKDAAHMKELRAWISHLMNQDPDHVL